MKENVDYLVTFESPQLGYGKVKLANPFKSGIPSGITVILGDNGSGKTTLGTIIEKGRYAYGNRLKFNKGLNKVKMLTFTDIHSFTGVDVSYYSQRLESSMNDYVPTVEEIFKFKIITEDWQLLTETFNLKNIISKKINYLSSGELRKLLIINALLERPALLILDNPYIGLDASSRDELDKALVRLKHNGLSVVLLICDVNDMPSYTDSLIELTDCIIGKPISEHKEITQFIDNLKNKSIIVDVVLPSLRPKLYPSNSTVFSIFDGHARYGDKVIFENFSWHIKSGESWALTGPNGSGKSLLLSMICADNPQGYANDIILFDRKRGTGESIWEIKDAIGYVCPEMQLYFRSNNTIRDIIVQGLRNSLNLYRQSTQEEVTLAKEWMTLLDIEYLENRKFNELSSGEQRMALVARALIRQPDLLVLDEPLHGLDKNHKERIKAIISALVERNHTSLIFVSHYSSELPKCITHHKKMGK